MSASRNRAFVVLKWLITLAAYVFLACQLSDVAYWEAFRDMLRMAGWLEVGWLLLLLALMPFNWALEAVKWQLLTHHRVVLRFSRALKAVLAGICTGYATPNRVGEFAGRVLFLPPEERVAGIALHLLNSFSQTLVITIFGLAGAFVYLAWHYVPTLADADRYIPLGVVAVMVALAFYLLLPLLARRVGARRFRSARLRSVVEAASGFSVCRLWHILAVAVVRYVVFCLQYAVALRLFHIEVSPLEALYTIPTMYLLITFTPSLAAAEPAIRGSYAALVFGVYSNNPVSIALTGIVVWLINFVIPMIAGTVVVMKVGNGGERKAHS